MFDLIIIGGGPAGVAAGVYAARKKLNTLIISTNFGGQSVVSENIYNWIGDQAVPGIELAKRLKNQLLSYQGPEFVVKEGLNVVKLEKKDGVFQVATDNGQFFQTKTVLITTGSSRRKLTVPGADQFEHKGITYCASCDGPLFAGQDVAVIGGGNAGFETASQLLAYVKTVTLIEASPAFRADELTVEKLKANPNFTALANTELTEIKGDKFVSGLTYKNKETAEIKELPVTGIFVEIGAVPAVGFAQDLVKTNSFGAIEADPRTQRTSVEGIWAAGDCTDVLYHQNNIAMGDAVKALEDIYLFLKA